MSTVVAASGVLGHPDADAVVVDGGRIAAVTSMDRLGRAADHAFPEGIVLPGLRDAHIHPVGHAVTLGGLNLGDAGRLGEVQERVRAHAAGLEAGAAVIGSRLDEERLEERRLPWRSELDDLAGGRPVLLHRVCGHVAVANTAALTAAGITDAAVDPPGGSIDRDGAGRPTGVLRESAVALVAASLPVVAPDPEEVLAVLRGLPALGITSIEAIIATSAAMWCGAASELDALVPVAHDLPIDVGVLVAADSPAALEQAAARVDSAGGRLRWLGWKGFADGSLGGRTAALDEPYADDPATAGQALMDADAAVPVARRAVEMGGTVAIHAIGDRGIRAALDLVDHLGPVADGRVRIEHASLVPPVLVRRMAESGVTASVQPSFARSDAGWLEDRLGAGRLAWAYPFRTLTRAGVPLRGGSDAPVEDPNPWPAIAAAADHPITPEESLTPGEALGAYLSHDFAPGSPADLVVVDRDPTAGAAPIASTEVLAAFAAGTRCDGSRAVRTG